MTNPHLEEVYEKYWQAFETFRRIPMIRTMDDNDSFCSTLKSLLDDHLTIIPSLTIGIVESAQHLSSEHLDGFMERMLRSRICKSRVAEKVGVPDNLHLRAAGPAADAGLAPASTPCPRRATHCTLRSSRRPLSFLQRSVALVYRFGRKE